MDFLWKIQSSLFIPSKGISMKSRPIFLRAMRLRSLPQSRLLLSPAPIYRSSPIRQISSTFPRLNENPKDSSSKSQSEDPSKGQQQQQKRKGPTPEENSGPVRSPFAVFAEVLKEEISKNKAWQENVKTLQGDVDKMADSAAMKRARDMYERARVSHESC